MVSTPAPIPVTIPDELPTPATDVLVEFQLPPVADSERVTLPDAHKESGPLIKPATGAGLMVTVKLAILVPQDETTE